MLAPRHVKLLGDATNIPYAQVAVSLSELRATQLAAERIAVVVAIKLAQHDLTLRVTHWDARNARDGLPRVVVTARIRDSQDKSAYNAATVVIKERWAVRRAEYRGSRQRGDEAELWVPGDFANADIADVLEWSYIGLGECLTRICAWNVTVASLREFPATFERVELTPPDDWGR